MTFRHVGLFAGIGGFGLACRRLGWESTFFNEIEKSCVDVLRENFPESYVCSKDIRELAPGVHNNILAEIDVLTAGFPCQSFSQAGNNLGFADDRGKLFFEIPKFINRMPQPPKVVLLENVAYLKVFDRGSRMRVVINELRRAGYWVSTQNAQVLDTATHTTIPHRRERLFIVAVHKEYFNRNNFKFPLPETDKLSDLWTFIETNVKGPEECYLPSGNKYQQMILEEAKKNDVRRLYQIRRIEARRCAKGLCPTLTANMGLGGHNVPFLVDNWGVRKLTVDECMALQGIEEGELVFPHSILDKDKYTMIGNAVTVDLAQDLFEKIGKVLNDLGDINGKSEKSNLAVS